MSSARSQIFLPDMTGYGFRVLPVLRAFLQFWAIPANIAFALIFPISFTVGSGITSELVFCGTGHNRNIHHSCTVPGQIPFLRHRPFVGKRWDFSTIEDLFANPWRFVPCIRCNDLYFRIMCLQALKYRIECYAVMNVTGRNFRLQYMAQLCRIRYAPHTQSISCALPCGILRFPGQWWILPPFFPSQTHKVRHRHHPSSAVSFHVLRDPLRSPSSSCS